MINKIAMGAAALTLGGALALSAVSPASAAPVTSNALALKAGTTDHVTDVRYRGRRYHRGYRYHPGGAAIAGLAAGVIGLAAAGALAPRYHYYEPYYHEPYAYYGGSPYVYSYHGYAPRGYYHHYYGW
ncbi:MAG TPA: hypothetical protein VHG27_09510 [Xanthobacteraceae bacterium]|nr:hypothetical protein [Xanthobacteraceae bacterium]